MSDKTIALRDRCRAMQKQGITSRDIAKHLGISQAYVSYLAPLNKRFDPPKGCVFPNIAEWMTAHRVNKGMLAMEIYGSTNSQSVHAVTQILKNTRRMRKDEIDKILALTGMTYEVAFATEKKTEVEVDSVAIYDECVTYRNCTVEIYRNSVTGEESIG